MHLPLPCAFPQKHLRMDTQNFIVRYPGYVNEIVTDCLVIKATSGMLTNAKEIVGFPFQALWDTGATNSMITSSVVAQLNLKPVTYATVYHAGGESEVPAFLAYISLPNDILIGPLQVIEGQLEGVDVLIGMDIIGNGDFVITNNEDHTTLSYTTPSTMKV